MNFVEVTGFFRNATTKAKIIACVIIFAFIAALVGFIIFSALPKQTVELNPVKISNYNNITSAPKSYEATISRTIYNAISKAEGTSNLDLGDAKIREESYRETTSSSGSTTAKFIIDIDSVHYSFEVSVIFNNSESDEIDPSVSITCPHYLDVIYKDKKCIAASPIAQVQRYLPYNEYLSNGQKFHAELRNYSGRSYIAVTVPECMNQTQKDEAGQKFRKWLKSIYLDPNDYDIETMGKCL